MAKYRIHWMEQKTSKAGRKFYKATLIDENENQNEDVAIFDSFPGFGDMRPEATIEGELKITQNGQYTNKILNPMVSASAWATGGKKPTGMAAAVKAKQESIEKAQDRKESSIEKMAVFRDATLLTTAYIAKANLELVTVDDMKTIWVAFHKWLQGKIEEPFI